MILQYFALNLIHHNQRIELRDVMTGGEVYRSVNCVVVQ